MVNSKATAWTLLNERGKRKYVTRQERDKFVEASYTFHHDIADFCMLLAATGCRISEALSLTPAHFDFKLGVVAVETLKRRRKGVYREIPLPPLLAKRIRHRIDESHCQPAQRLWSWSRMTGYRHVCAVMERAEIHGIHASPKGLRHGFAVIAIQSGIPLNLVQKWLGHADMKTTAIYAAAMGQEEQEIAARMWMKQSRCA
ncbi:integrase [Sphingobium sp. B11D3B]|uniref:tyrosine-type recombinase/integrase n=1 Tax=Sphingobium sp. B11D3B TaxID=2940575 RepID=UPI002227902E|nr:site-specific integrase [Sphingobium sp. B11D3B]MCW2387184.1 integrase [Sphingobium sp. B11D3B]